MLEIVGECFFFYYYSCGLDYLHSSKIHCLFFQAHRAAKAAEKAKKALHLEELIGISFAYFICASKDCS
jgi:hypothetical protein